MLKKEWTPLSYGQVKIRDSFLRNSMLLEREYLLSLDADRLLAGFRQTAGLKSVAIRYPGWESTEIRGHTMGHYLAAMSQLWASEHEPKVRERLEYVTEELAKCQREDGYLSAFSEELFDRVERKEPAWVPWYTMHKIIAGITAVYIHTGNESARRIMERLADWAAERALSWTEETKKTVLAVEYGGMNDCLYEVYRITGNPRHAQAAHQFDELPLFAAMERGEDILDGLHANTTIPKILGGLKRYEVLGGEEPFYLKMAENFWDIVTKHHTYITGGNSEWEHFGKPDILDCERTACNCETCNTYNMLKLSALLFRNTGKKKYADYDEKTYINAILSSQNHETGMTTYFQPMGTGYFKVYSRPYDNFWCCTGTGMENFTKQCENICYADEDGLCINRFVSVDIRHPQKGVTLRLEADLLHEEPVRIYIGDMDEPGTAMRLAIRIPDWMAAQPKAELAAEDGSEEGISRRIGKSAEDGYLIFHGKWEPGDIVTLALPMELRVKGLSDNERAAAFCYGPFVLSADLGREDLRTDVTGVNVTVPTKDVEVPEYLLIRGKVGMTREQTLLERMSRVRRTDGIPEFVYTSADGGKLLFAPHFLKNDVRYGIYFYVFEEESEELENYQKEAQRRREVLRLHKEVVPLGNDQYELAFGIQGHRTESGNVNGRRTRIVKPGGWFSYELQIPEEDCGLHLTVRKDGEFTIFLDGCGWIGNTEHGKQSITGDSGERDVTEELFEGKIYPIPEEYRGKKIRICFRNESEEKTLMLADEIYISLLELLS